MLAAGCGSEPTNEVGRSGAAVSWTGARLSHALSRRQLEIGFGLFLLLVSARFVASLF
jgi:uncharacterized membrane protein YfcA